MDRNSKYFKSIPDPISNDASGTNWDINPLIVKAQQIHEVSREAKEDIIKLYRLVCEISLSRSQNDFYSDIEEWSKPIYTFIKSRLEHFGFINGQKKQVPDAQYWLHVFELFLNITLSRHLNTDVVRYQASAFERNEAFKKELEDWIARLNERPNLIRMPWPV
jgi:hypothetical protein